MILKNFLMQSEESVPIKLAGGLTIRAQQVGNVTILEFEGEISRKKKGIPSLCEYINDEVTRGKRDFVFSFRNLCYLDSYGIGQIMASYTSIRGVGGKLKSVCLPKKMFTVFNFCLFSPPWKIRPQADSFHDTVEEALESFGIKIYGER